MLCSGKKDEPPDGGESEDRMLLSFAQADCTSLNAKKKKSPLQVLLRIIKLPFNGLFYFVALPFWSQRMPMAEIRKTIDTFAPNTKRKPNSLCAFYFVNRLLWHLCKHISTLALNINDGKHAVFIMREIWERTFASSGDFFQLYAELRPRDYASFCERDKTHFKARNGDIFTEKAAETLYYILILTPRGNKFLRLLYSWGRELIYKELLRPGKESPLTKLLVDNPEHRLSQIRNIRRNSLERLETYADNMLRFTLDNGSTEAAALWNEVICLLRELKGFRPMPETRGKLAALVKEMARSFNSAGKRTYIQYCAQESVALSAPSTPERSTKEKAAVELPLETKSHSRFTVLIYAKHYVITDTLQKKKPYKISKTSNAGSIVRQLILNYATGTDQTHVSDKSWKGAFQAGRGDATRFKNDQIFILPRWDAEKQHYMTNQKSNRWRLWTDEELKMKKSERQKKFIEEHPNGLPR